MKASILCAAIFAFITQSSIAGDSSEPEKIQSIGVCLGKGGLKNIAFGGATGNSCNGLIEWGRYELSGSQKEEICSCKGTQTNINGVTFWGPKGEPCTGWVGAGMYVANCQPLKATTLASCVGRGGVAGHRLYGPKGMACGGFANWGNYE